MYRLRKLSLSLLASCVCWAGATVAQAETVTLIGTGMVGSALGPRLSSLGHRVIYGSRNPERDDVRRLVRDTASDASASFPAQAAAEADIVVLAVPWDVVEEVIRNLGDLSGKIIIDPTNPRREADDGFRDYAFDGSNAERIQALAPNAFVVKAFNTLAATVMTEPATAGGPVTIPLVGDSEEAKSVVADIVRGFGFEPVNVGPLRHARIIEGLHYLRYNGARLGNSFNYHFRVEEVATVGAL